MLAMLPAMTWTWRSMAAIPVAAVSSARMLRSPQSPEELTGRLLRQLLQRVAALIALLLQDGGDVAVTAGDLNHARHLGDGIDVRFLERALDDAGVGRRRTGIDAGRRHEGRATVLLQELRLIEAGDLQLAALRIDGARALAYGDDAVRADVDVVVGGLERDRAAAAEHLIAFAGDELAGGVGRERAVSGIALAARRLHHEIALVVERDVERIAGALDGAGAEIDPGCAVLHVADLPVAAAEALVAGARHQKFAERRVVGLESRGVDIGDVVGDDVELMTERHLPRQADEKGILHRILSPKSEDDAVSRASSSRAPPALPSSGRGRIAEPVPTDEAYIYQWLNSDRRAARRAESAIAATPPGK